LQARQLDHHNVEGDLRVKAGEVLLDVCGVGKRFGGLTALRDVSFKVQAAEIVALIGPNGAGKSTLFNAITGFGPPNSGSIVIRGENVQGRSPNRIAALGVRRTFQHVKLLPDRSVLENVALGAYGHSRSGILRSILRLDRGEERGTFARAQVLIERIGLADKTYHRAADLALGQQRLVEIARALAAGPLLLMLDEPAAGLRYLEKQALAEVLRQLKDSGIGILLVEHDMGFVMALADRVVVMSFGEKIAEGAACEIQADPIVREAYLGV
jgi:branched-chain amino acid transport system permease protein